MIDTRLVTSLVADSQSQEATILLGKYFTECELEIVSEFADEVLTNPKVAATMATYNSTVDDVDKFNVLLTLGYLSPDNSDRIRRLCTDIYRKYFDEYFPKMSPEKQSQYLETLEEIADEELLELSVLVSANQPQAATDLLVSKAIQVIVESQN